jgi:hypothetical protein
MPVPDFQTLMRLLLEEYAVGGERRSARCGRCWHRFHRCDTATVVVVKIAASIALMGGGPSGSKSAKMCASISSSGCFDSSSPSADLAGNTRVLRSCHRRFAAACAGKNCRGAERAGRETGPGPPGACLLATLLGASPSKRAPRPSIRKVAMRGSSVGGLLRPDGPQPSTPRARPSERRGRLERTRRVPGSPVRARGESCPDGTADTRLARQGSDVIRRSLARPAFGRSRRSCALIHRVPA